MWRGNNMKYIIHYRNDSIIVEGETTEECRKQKDIEVSKRGWEITDCWSEPFESRIEGGGGYSSQKRLGN